MQILMVIYYIDNALTEYVKTTSLLLQDTTTQNPRALEVYLWITKALILRAHPLCYELTDKVIEWCGLSIQGVAHGFDILVGDDVYALNKSLFATVTVSGWGICVEGLKIVINDIS